MLAKRVIPCLDVDRGRVVKGTNFVNLRDAGDPVQVAARYEAEGADELVFLDITASHEGREIMLDVVRRTAEVIFMPLHRRRRNPHAGRYPRFALGRLRQGVDQHGRLAGSRVRPRRRPGASAASASWSISIPSGCRQDGREVWEVHTHGGRRGTGLEAVAWAAEVERLGAGEIVLTSMDADGTKNGYDLEITRAVSQAVSVPVVASGGAGKPEHLADAILLGKADAALAASIFHFGEYTIHQTKAIVARAGDSRSRRSLKRNRRQGADMASTADAKNLKPEPIDRESKAAKDALAALAAKDALAAKYIEKRPELEIDKLFRATDQARWGAICT